MTQLSNPVVNKIYLSGSTAESRISSRLRDLISRGLPKAVGMATAFLSIDGARTYDTMLNEGHVDNSRVVVGLSGEITHPRAIEYLVEKDHSVRFGIFPGGIFHPKLLVGGDRFLKSGNLSAATCGYVGSANFTGAGLFRNMEVMLATCDPTLATDVSDAFSTVWTGATPLTESTLREYERAFARAQRRRSVSDLEFLEVVDPETTASMPNKRPTLIKPQLCSAVWAGLQSFTGEHTFQVEFPRTAGEALRTLLTTSSGEVEIECADGESRMMRFRYYSDNGMYRLNVPNSVPLVQWARDNHQGALLVWKDDLSEDTPLNAEIIRGRRLADSVARSRALGSWGQTSTRQHGWY